ncbi:hypothetical protein QRD89_11745 [Halobacillus sp. ACCC02827]|uniref:hypothetical protein n=1 Tax=Bacillaceae TaxID=186817 RepID=UPI0002A5135D|nr:MULTISPECIES: hypothetical protein [Bacillaceae]ELK46211.1 hypothetical protein D479_11381 [Halobacillus sp. BAB-2008]QHT47168.1 endolytic transglycosylase MltG [Bacillus sp. SB49]WJE14397.1 hypothetical protein QRD89_11745 [Halobacillus sp. ACCC02827]
MKTSLRAFSLGLMTSALILAGFLWITDEPVKKVESRQLPAKEEMISQLEDDGYAVMTSDERAALTAEQPVEAAKPDTAVHTFSLDITAGTTLPDIIEKLARTNILQDPDALSDYMEENDYSRYIRQGTVTVNSNMSMEEIAEAISTK